jgi:hypothetical protein
LLLRLLQRHQARIGPWHPLAMSRQQRMWFAKTRRLK